MIDNGHGLFSLDLTNDPNRKKRSTDESDYNWPGEFAVQGSLPRELGGDGMVMPYPSADEQFDAQHKLLEEEFEHTIDWWKEMHARRDLGELDE